MQVIANFGVAQGSDGRHRAMLNVATGASVTALAIDPDEADAFADALANGIKQAAAEARRLNSGLIVPGVQVPADLSQLFPANGNGRH